MLNQVFPVTRFKIFGARILYFFTTLFTGKEKRIIERHGIKYEIDLSEGMELSLFLFGDFQKHIFYNEYLKIEKNFVILDIGANVGLMTLQFAKAAPQGRIYSFEPTHYALERLKKNVSLNPELSKHITVINSFVSEKSSSSPDIVAYSSWKVDGEKHTSNHPVHLGAPKDTSGVPSVSLNDFVMDNGIEKIDFIKIDTDGHEYEVFKGAAEAIKKFRPKIVFEIGLYVMGEKHITFEFYHNYFKSLDYYLVDTKSNRKVDLQNYKNYIPKKGTTDLIAVPD